MNHSGNNELDQLTTLRFVSAFLVFIYHWWSLNENIVPPNFIISNAYVGVDIFFVLSGFLLALRNFDNLKNRTFVWSQYLVKRIARIWPVYLCILFMVFITGTPVGLPNVILTQGLNPNAVFSGIAPAWTLTVEECFYLLLPAILSTMSVTHLSTNLVRLMIWSGCFILIGAGIYSDFSFMLGRTIFGYLVDFSIGILVSRIYVEQGPCPPKRSFRLIGLGIAGFIATEALLSVRGEGLYSGRLIVYLIPIMAGVIIYGLTANNIVTRIAALRPFVYFGRISYAFYLIHFTSIAESININDWLIYYLVATLLSMLIYHVVERPSQHFIVSRFAFVHASANPIRTKTN